MCEWETPFWSYPSLLVEEGKFLLAADAGVVSLHALHIGRLSPQVLKRALLGAF